MSENYLEKEGLEIFRLKVCALPENISLYLPLTEYYKRDRYAIGKQIHDHICNSEMLPNKLNEYAFVVFTEERFTSLLAEKEKYRFDVKKLLQQIEWVKDDYNEYCAACGNPKTKGHTKNCQLEKLLN